jgi:hypothetical protein
VPALQIPAPQNNPQDDVAPNDDMDINDGGDGGDGDGGGGDGDQNMGDLGERFGPDSAEGLPDEFQAFDPGSNEIKAQIKKVLRDCRRYYAMDPQPSEELDETVYQSAFQAAGMLVIWVFDFLEGNDSSRLCEQGTGHLFLSNLAVTRGEDGKNDEVVERDFPKLNRGHDIYPNPVSRSFTLSTCFYFILQSAYQGVAIDSDDFDFVNETDVFLFGNRIVSWAVSFIVGAPVAKFRTGELYKPATNDVLRKESQDIIWSIFEFNRDRETYHCGVFERNNDSFDEVLRFLSAGTLEGPRLAVFWKMGAWQTLLIFNNEGFSYLTDSEVNTQGGLSDAKSEFGTKLEVWRGLAVQTRGGLQAKDLMLNKKCRVVSKKAADAARARYERNAVGDDGEEKPINQVRGAAHSFAQWRQKIAENDQKFPDGVLGAKKDFVNQAIAADAEDDDEIPGLEPVVPIN